MLIVSRSPGHPLPGCQGSSHRLASIGSPGLVRVGGTTSMTATSPQSWRTVRKDPRWFMHYLKMFSWLAPSLQGLKSCHFFPPSALRPYVHWESLGATVISSPGSTFYSLCWMVSNGPPTRSQPLSTLLSPGGCSLGTMSSPRTCRSPAQLLPAGPGRGLEERKSQCLFPCSAPAGSAGRGEAVPGDPSSCQWQH